VKETTVEEANAYFFKYLQQVYAVFKGLEEEVSSTPNTKKEIKVQLAHNEKGLITWGRHTGKVSPTTSIRGIQVTLESKIKPVTADSQTSPCKEFGASAVSTIEDTVPSPDRSRFELPTCIEVLRNMMISQGNAVGKLAEKVEKIQIQQQQAQQGNTRKNTGKPAK